jgi:transcriptional regulator with XRE-family HTH domain
MWTYHSYVWEKCALSRRGMVHGGRVQGKPMNRKVQPSPEIASIGARLRRLRKERQLTQCDLARQIGIQQSDLSRMEQGEYRVSLDNLVKILSVFDLDVAQFFRPQAEPAPVHQALSSQDMQTMQLLRQLSPQGRQEVQEYLEFKLRREVAERRARDAQTRSRFGS